MTSPVRASRLSSAAPAVSPRRPAAPGRIDAPRRDARDRHLAVVAPASPRRRSGATVALAATIVFASMIAAGLMHSQVVSGQIHLDGVERQIEVERTGLAQDRLTLAGEQSPARIAEAATERGMVPSEGQRWLSPDAPPVDGDTAPTPKAATDTGDQRTGGDERADVIERGANR